MQKERRVMLGPKSDNPRNDPHQNDEIDLMRQRMLRELEHFLSRSIDRPFPRLRLLRPSPPRTKKAKISLN
jgi:hypothetical protein